MSFRRLALLAALIPALAPAQQAGDAWRDYLVNGIGSGQGSVVTSAIDLVTAPVFANRYLTQDPGAPVVWWISASANPGQLQIGPNSIDIGDAALGFADLGAIGNGLESGFWHSLFSTNASGRLEIDVSVAPGAAGQVAHFAMMHFAATSPVGFWMSQTHRAAFVFPDVVVRARGANNLNADTNSGFWQVLHQGTLPAIDEVTLDFSSATDPVVATTEFDVDQPGLAERFVWGNGVAPANGTYRNGSDLACGLVYDAQNTYDMVMIGGLVGGNCGFIASNPLGTPFDWQTLRFRFAPGAFTGTLFEFDCDTDAGAGVGGADMAGCRVTVVLEDGTVHQGALTALPGAPVSTAQVSF